MSVFDAHWDAIEEIAGKLSSARPEVVHVIGSHWNYDAGTAVVDRIIALPQCDGGTARAVFWGQLEANPDLHDFSPTGQLKALRWVGVDHVALVEKVGMLAALGRYQSNTLSSDADDLVERIGLKARLTSSMDRAQDAAALGWRLSDVLRYTGGRRVTADEFAVGELAFIRETLQFCGSRVAEFSEA